MKHYKMPQDTISNQVHVHSMILLLFPTMATKSMHQKRWDPDFSATLQTEIKTTFWKIFKENNIDMRRKFF